MKAMITGKGGQLGDALIATAPAGIQLDLTDRMVLDLNDRLAIAAYVAASRPDIVINAAAYTAVDKAETDFDTATAINNHAVEALAVATRKAGARLVHISTDFVFDGQASSPYPVDASVAPLGVYGQTKYAGEVAALAAGALVVRTAWVYAKGGQNFVMTMLRLMTQREEIRVVNDQFGTPTWANSLAEGVWQMVEKNVSGVYHYTDGGIASWYEFADAIQDHALNIGLLKRRVKLTPITTSEYPTAAQRPAYSVLDKDLTTALLGHAPSDWRVNLHRMLEEMAADG